MGTKPLLLIPAGIDLNQIVRGLNYEKLDECVKFITQTPLNSLLNSRVLDPSVSKIFTLSQYCLQYLLFCTQFLDKTVSSLRDELYAQQTRSLELKDELMKRNDAVESILRKVKKRVELFPCKECSKKFETQELLDGHVDRRHKDNHHQEKPDDNHLINTLKLEIEIRDLKQKLNASEKALMDTKLKECDRCLEHSKLVFKDIGIQHHFEINSKDIGIQSNSEEKELDDIERSKSVDEIRLINESLRNKMDESFRQFQAYKEIEEKRHHQEVNDIKKMLVSAVNDFKRHVEARPKSPSIAPRKTVAIQASEDINEANVSQNSFAYRREEENLWKTRYCELQKMYEDIKVQVPKSMKNQDRAYSEKIQNLEESVRKLQAELKESNSRRLETIPKRPPKPKPRALQLIPSKVVQNKELIPNVRIKKPKKVYSTSSEDEDKEFIIQKPVQRVHEFSPKVLEKPQVSLNKLQSLSSPENASCRKTFSGQKWLPNNHQKKSEEITKLPTSSLNQTKRTDAEHKFSKRLSEFKIDTNQSTLSSKKMEEVQSEMASRRDEQKKSHPRFFITRKKIKTKVEELFKSYQNSKQAKANQPLIPENIEKIVAKNINILDDEKHKKRVLFNIQEQSSFSVKSNEDSDFDVSSLESDRK